MQTFYKTLVNPLKLLFLTVLMSTLGFAFAAQLAHHKSYDEDTSKLVILEFQEASADAEELPQLDDTSAILTYAPLLQFSSNLNPHHLVFSEFVTRLAFLYHIRPRSPPLLQTS